MADDEVRAWIREGRVVHALRRIDEALAAGDDPDSRSARAEVLAAWGREREAAHERRLALHAGRRDGYLLRALGWESLAARRGHEAAEAFRAALSIDPSDAEARFGCAAVDQFEGRNDRAIETFESLAADQPGEPSFVLAIARCELSRMRADAAERRLRDWLARNGDQVDVRTMLGRLLQQAGRLDDAAEQFRIAIAVADREHRDADAFLDLAILACEAGDYPAASALLLERLPRYPKESGHRLLAPVLLAMGDTAEGWRQLEYRWFAGPQAALRAPYDLPVWRGQPLAGRTLLVRAEQGFGDTIQYARFLPKLKALGATILFLPIQGLGQVVHRFRGVDRVVLDDSAAEGADYYVPLMSVPAALGTSLVDLPPVAPLAPLAADVVSRWSARFPATPRLRVALAWAGRPDHPRDGQRSIELERLAGLLAIPGIEWVSLQKGVAIAQAERVPDHVAWTSVGPELDDFDDADAVLGRVDLLITVDTALAHLAATRDVPTWMLTAEPADCRWLVGRSDSPWYPAMRLFRQSGPGRWAPVIETVARELSNAVRAKELGRPMRTELVGRPATPARAPDPPAMSSRPAHLARVTDTRSGWLQYDPDDERTGRAIEGYGEHEEPAIRFLESVVRPGEQWLEAGAGVGLRTLRVAKRVGDAGHVLAFEPRDPMRPMLVQNLGANGLRNVTVLSASLVSTARDSGFAPDTAVDDLGLSRLAGMIVDAGGTADALFEGAASILWRDRPALFVFAPVARVAQDAAARMRHFGYRSFVLEIPAYSLTNYRRAPELAEGAGAPPTWLVAGFAEEREPPPLPPGCVESA